MKQRVLSSKWSGLNAELLASIFAVNFDGSPVVDGVTVVAPPTDGTLELTANWQSPFEHMGAETKAPAIAAMLQTGTLQGAAETLLGKGSGDGLRDRLAREISDFSQAAQGRSGMTKLNSTQVFTGAAPIKIPLTLHFRAFDSPNAEVRQPIDQLARWTLARQLAANGSIVSAIQNFKQGQGLLKSLLPSQAPQMVALRFGGYTFAPLVIESMTMPMTVPRASDGEPVAVAVQLVLASLTALDAEDWARARRGEPIALFNT
jgi:hypothetical protein